MAFPVIYPKHLQEQMKIAGSAKAIMCGYCGNENYSDSDLWVCSHCENPNQASLITISLNDPVLMGAIASTNKLLQQNYVRGALAEYEKVTKNYADPGFIYYYALLHIQASNYEVSQIRYDRKGFMEENATHRSAASDFASKARRLLFKTAVVCQKNMAEDQKNPLLPFVLFMASVKLGNLRTAKRAVEQLSQLESPLLLKYADMLYNMELGKYDIAASRALEMTKKGFMSINAFYYISLALLKVGRIDMAQTLLGAYGKYVQNNSVNALAGAIAAEEKV